MRGEEEHKFTESFWGNCLYIFSIVINCSCSQLMSILLIMRVFIIQLLYIQSNAWREKFTSWDSIHFKLVE